MHKEGDILHDRYTILRLQSEGGMSYVYKVEDQRLHKFWALKELKADRDILESSVEFNQFKTEARVLADFSHPAFPGIVDFFIDEKKAYLVEEWVEGRTIEALCAEPLSEERILELAHQLLDALEEVHKRGIVYRDLKPQNIMVTGDYRVKLIDFGTARFYKAGKKKDTLLVGTPGYAPPEQYGKGQTDVRTDIYSLGATLYFMVTGAHPPEDRFDIELPGDCRQNVSPLLGDAMKKAMKSKPEERYQTLDELRTALQPGGRRRRFEHPAVLAGVVIALVSIVLCAEARVPAFYFVLLGILVYGFIWAVREIKKGRNAVP
jgi:serine/threonine protein kinase